MKIYTKTGDTGETSLFDGTRVSKTHPRVAAYGEVDELQASIGMARAAGLPDDLDTMCVTMQRDLFAVGAQLADPRHRIADRVEKAHVHEAHIAQLERWIDVLDTELPPLRHFILSGGGPAGAALHLARAICRRAERALVSLGQSETVRPALRQYLNRLSDLMFVLARVLNRHAGGTDVLWQQGRNK